MMKKLIAFALIIALASTASCGLAASKWTENAQEIYGYYKTKFEPAILTENLFARVLEADAIGMSAYFGFVASFLGNAIAPDAIALQASTNL